MELFKALVSFTRTIEMAIKERVRLQQDHNLKYHSQEMYLGSKEILRVNIGQLVSNNSQSINVLYLIRFTD